MQSLPRQSSFPQKENFEHIKLSESIGSLIIYFLDKNTKDYLKFSFAVFVIVSEPANSVKILMNHNCFEYPDRIINIQPASITSN